MEKGKERREQGGAAANVIRVTVKEEITKWFKGFFVGRMIDARKV